MEFFILRSCEEEIKVEQIPLNFKPKPKFKVGDRVVVLDDEALYACYSDTYDLEADFFTSRAFTIVGIVGPVEGPFRYKYRMDDEEIFELTTMEFFENELGRED